MLIVIGICAAVMAVRARRRRRALRNENARSEALIETTDLLLATSRAGFSLTQAVMMLADIAPDSVRSSFARVRDAVETGASLPSALSGVRTDLGPAFHSLIGLVISAARLGVPTESFIVHLQAHARHVHRHHSESAARRLSVRLALPLVICTLPSFVVLIIVPVVAGTLEHLHLQGGTP